MHKARQTAGLLADTDYFEATILEPLIRKNRSYAALADCRALDSSLRSVSNLQQVRISFDTTVPRNLDYGSKLLVRKKLQLIRNNSNPGGFNYQSYSNNKGIYFQVYLAAGDYRVLKGWHGSTLRKILFQTREYCIHNLRKFITPAREAGLAEALLIGYKNDLDKDLLQSYSNTGVVHLIAISGLHLGLIFLILRKICSILRLRNRAVKAIVVLSGLWFFSILVGGSPSVLRSAVMFSFLVSGELAVRKIPAVNSLAASAFFLLCVDPNWIVDAGFQLSYAAVLSLILYARPLYSSFSISNPLLDSAWQLSCVTIAAQAFTLPVTLYYFHQFPNAFVFTNLIAIPLSNIALMTLILLVVICFMPLLSSLVGTLATALLWMMNAFIIHVERIPFSSWYGISISILQSLWLSIAIIAFTSFLLKPRRIAFYIVLFALLCFTLERTHSFFQAANQRMIIVYYARGHQVVQFVSGRSSTVFASNSPTQEFMRDLRAANTKYRISSTRFRAMKTNSEVAFHRRKILVLVSPAPAILKDPQAYQTIILFRHARIIGRDRDLIVRSAANVVIEESLTPGALKRTGITLPQQAHSLADKGAFVLKLN